MKNTARNTLAYTGAVTLSQYIGSKKIKITQKHNSGGKPLFDFLDCCFIGDFPMARALLPKKIGLVTTTDDSGDINATSTQIGDFCYLITGAKKVESTANRSAVCYSFIIPIEDLGNVEDFEKTFVCLYTEHEEDLSNYMAKFSLSGYTKSLFLNSALVVDWELNIANLSTTTNSGATN